MKNFDIENNKHIKRLNTQAAKACGFEVKPNSYERTALVVESISCCRGFNPIEYDDEAAKLIISKNISLLNPEYSGASVYKAVGLAGAHLVEAYHENWRVAVCMCVVEINEAEQAQAESEKDIEDMHNPFTDGPGSA